MTLVKHTIIFSISVMITLIIAPPIHAESVEVLTSEHIAKLRMVTTAKMSPDGQHIAYTLSVPRMPFEDDDGGAWTELHVVDLQGNARPFVTGHVKVASVDWTPDGRGLSFLAKRGDDEHKSLYVIPIDGGEAKNILTHSTDISSYSWSADGQRVAFIAKEKALKKRKALKDKGFKQEIYEEDFHPKRVWIATPYNKDDKPRKLSLPGFPSGLHWGPVGDVIAVALAPTPLIDDHYMKRKLFAYHADTGEIVSSFPNVGKLGAVTWSPDGRHLAVIAAADINDPSAGRLVIASLGDGTLKDIKPNYEGQISSVAWLNNNTVMYLGDQRVWTTLGNINRDTGQEKVLIDEGSYALSRMSLSKDGLSMAMLSSSPTHPSEVFTISHGNTTPRRLTNSNPWLEHIRLAKQEVITYKAKDGLEIDGLLIRPLDEIHGKKYPLILTVHGGPESHYRHSWLTRYSGPGQVAAARGFAVFYPNYRGSTGRGVAFSKMGQADYAGAEFSDLIDGVDHLIEMGLVDRDKVGVTGGSYGGFATAWCSTYYSHRFAAGVMFVGISNHISKSGTTDIPNEMFLVHARRKLQDSWDFFKERSPLFHVEKAKTPLLIMHGKNDPRVHPSQSMELYRHLKILDQAPVRLVFYPGEGHGNRKAAARYDYNVRMLRWFEHYLKGEGGDPPNYEINYPLDKDDKDESSEDA